MCFSLNWSDYDNVSHNSHPFTLLTPAANLQVGAQFQLQVDVGQHFDTRINWSSDNPNVATVNNNGIVVAIASGEAHITGTLSSGLEPPVTAIITVVEEIFDIDVTVSLGFVRQDPSAPSYYIVPVNIAIINFMNVTLNITYRIRFYDADNSFIGQGHILEAQVLNTWETQFIARNYRISQQRTPTQATIAILSTTPLIT